MLENIILGVAFMSIAILAVALVYVVGVYVDYKNNKSGK